MRKKRREGSKWGNNMKDLKHILVVEDDDVMRKSLELMLREHYDVHCEKYGKMAISFLKCQKVDLILLDMNMPFLNGLETLEKIRQIPEYEMSPVVFLAGAVDADVKKNCFALGAKAFLTKPVVMQDLIKALDNILYEKKGRSRLAERKTQEVAEVTRNFMPIAESVLLVGEDRDFLETIRQHLQGYLPRLAVGKDAALLYLDKLRPAVIYVEEQLASTGDFNLIRKFRMQPYAWKIPIVLFSQSGQLEYAEEIYKKEGIDFLIQEPTKEKVLECLKEALS